MSPDELHSFLAAYEAGSLKRAAAGLHVSQPTLSRRIQRLEDVLGVILFTRGPSGLAPTSYGHALARRARLIVRELELAQREMVRLRATIGGYVAFGASPGVAVGLLPTLAERLAESHPGLHMTIIEGVSESLVEQVLERRLEFAVCTAPLERTEALEVDSLGTDPFVIAAAEGHPLVEPDPVPLADTLSFPWVMPTFRGLVRHWVESRFTEAGLPPPVPRIETSSMMLIKPLLADGRHLSYLPARLVAADYPGVVALRCIPNMVLRRSLAVIRLRHRDLSPPVERLIATLRILAAAPAPLNLRGL